MADLGVRGGLLLCDTELGLELLGLLPTATLVVFGGFPSRWVGSEAW